MDVLSTCQMYVAVTKALPAHCCISIKTLSLSHSLTTNQFPTLEKLRISNKTKAAPKK